MCRDMAADLISDITVRDRTAFEIYRTRAADAIQHNLAASALRPSMTRRPTFGRLPTWGCGPAGIIRGHNGVSQDLCLANRPRSNFLKRDIGYRHFFKKGRGTYGILIEEFK